ncbi:hypothetical protein EMO89_02805 [Bifidobacterium tissieri]|uniref:DoxX n=1 Tax=Bifidobacterium tissieri TaxID=1630162 RepID=A0A5M9ZVS1_9BIFI|nr:hypothetical protein EM849_11170 [Bifidobacterium tissieri]KAA8831721.1 hypothetical protein EMO89_02805 [Bifidobacterium tissieri]
MDTAPTTETTPEHAAPSTYTPVFNDTVRTIIYIVTLLAGVIGLGVSAFGDPQVGAYISSAAGIIAAAFGVTYNPMRLSSK